MTEFRWIRAKKFSFPLGSGIHLKTRKWHKSDVQRQSVVAFRVPTKASGHWLQKSEDDLNQSGHFLTPRSESQPEMNYHTQFQQYIANKLLPNSQEQS